MASVFLLFMILFSFIVSCGVMIKDFKESKSKKVRVASVQEVQEEDYDE